MKKIPCEECREQKRKCNGEIPCERCNKFRLNCVYSSIRSPRDEEYIELMRQSSLIEQVEILNKQMKNMEIYIHLMKGATNSSMSTSATNVISPNHSIPSLVDDNSVSNIEESSFTSIEPSFTSETPLSEITTNNRSTKRIKLNELLKPTDKKDDYDPNKVEDQVGVPWKMVFKKGRINIETEIFTHSDLLNNLYRMMGATDLLNRIPPTYKGSEERNNLVGLLKIFIRKKFGKTHYKNIAKSIRIFVTPDPSTSGTITMRKPTESIATITMKLLRAYIRCQHLQLLSIHVRTFIRLFVDDRPIEKSPAAMALCATICTFRCKHVAACLPSISLIEFGQFFFEQARDLVDFDNVNLESLTTYTFLTTYKLAISRNKDARLYADMAERIATLLRSNYVDIMKTKQTVDSKDHALYLQKKGEAVHFSRLVNHLHRAQSFELITSNVFANKKISFGETNLPFCTLIHLGEGRWDMAEDDSIQEKWFVEMHAYILKLQRAEHATSKYPESSDLHQLVGSIAHQVEMSMRHWYNQVLPPEFKLSMPLFNADIGCDEYYTTLERECAHSAIPVLTTLSLYEEWIVLGQAYLHKSVPLPEHNWQLLYEKLERLDDPDLNLDPKWSRRMAKLADLRKHVDFDGTDQEFALAIRPLMGPTETRINTELVVKSLYAAFNSVRLLNYLQSRDTDCYFDIKALIHSWQILLIASKTQKIMPAPILKLIPRVHTSMKMCVYLVKEELKSHYYQGKVGDYVEIMESDLKSQIIEDGDDNCDGAATFLGV